MNVPEEYENSMKEKLLMLIIEIKMTFPVILTYMALIELFQSFFKERRGRLQNGSAGFAHLQIY